VDKHTKADNMTGPLCEDKWCDRQLIMISGVKWKWTDMILTQFS